MHLKEVNISIKSESKPLFNNTHNTVHYLNAEYQTPASCISVLYFSVPLSHQYCSYSHYSIYLIPFHLPSNPPR